MNVGPRGFLNILNGILQGAFPRAIVSDAGTHNADSGELTILLNAEEADSSRYLVTFTRLD